MTADQSTAPLETPMPLVGIPERVARGVALLDQKRPGWEQEIDLDTLDISKPCFCVVGQMYKSYFSPFEAGAVDLVGWDAYDYDDNAPALIEHGFSGVRSADDDGEFDALTVEWNRVIRARRAAPTQVSLPLGEEA